MADCGGLARPSCGATCTACFPSVTSAGLSRGRFVERSRKSGSFKNSRSRLESDLHDRTVACTYLRYFLFLLLSSVFLCFFRAQRTTLPGQVVVQVVSSCSTKGGKVSPHRFCTYVTFLSYNNNNVNQIVLLREKSQSENNRKCDATSYTGKEKMIKNVKMSRLCPC